ncbi:4440_t:CDS:10 [Paraglomus brasilianum]|uniref:E3 ubiquitin-protein ligase PEP5 n=1 Tax=Paraglomus brasilianum TaxID=144538 RepID=A0A9N9B2K7_9GLOM|nr:4440_t:CDS:10 [Paraglomus brasilianum]
MTYYTAASKQWRQFNFFDAQQVRDPIDPSKSPSIFQQADITVSTSSIYIVDRSYNVQSFVAYDGGRVTHMKQMKQKNILVTIGEDDPMSSSPIIKIWELDKQDRSKNAPTCRRTIKVETKSKPFPVSTFAVLENMSQIAVGLANGNVVLIRGDIQRERSTKQRIVYEGEEPVTGLGFREQNKSVILFIVTTTKVLMYTTGAKNPLTVIDEQGCALGCAIMNDITHEMIIARDEAIYFYGPEGRGPCYFYEGAKASVSWFKSNLVIVSPPVTQPARVASARALSSSAAPLEYTKVAIFDTANKFIAYTGNFSQGVRTVTSEWGAVFVLGMDGKLYKLEEKDTPTKLEILFKKNLYLLAINLAHSQKYDDASISEIFKKYGDHLYSKGDYDNAMSQYIRTIGQLEPSYVIRKFLDAQRIHNLVNYLQELHSKNLANTDHTTLLLNCYTKLKDVARLDQFIKTDNELTFDLETAIKVCRQAGYYEHALYLAKKFEEHDLYLKIQIEDVKDYVNALEYIRKLGPTEADRNLQKYGKILLNHISVSTTQLLIDLCTGNLLIANQQSTPPAVTPQPSVTQSPIPILPSYAFLQFGNSASAQAHPLPQLETDKAFESPRVTQKGKSPLSYRLPPVTRFMSLFVDQPNYLIQFLEQVSAKRWKGFGPSKKGITPAKAIALGARHPSDSASDEVKSDSKGFIDEIDAEAEQKKAVWNTLLELYLSEAYLPPVVSSKDRKGRKNAAPGSFVVTSEKERYKERLARRDNAMKLLKDEEVEYDCNAALVLCHLAQFDDGIIYLYEKTQMYEEILRFHMAKDNTDKVMQGLRKYGPHDQSLYPLVLTYFSSSPTILASSTAELLQILDYIDAHNLLPPLQIIQALSRNSVATLGMVTKCTACGGTLDLPAIHFLCRHSYHQRCLPDTDRECPKCAVEHRFLAEVRRKQEINAEKHDLFVQQLEDAEDGFSVIADYFSKNTMAFTKLID